jgi:hypothetical protein
MTTKLFLQSSLFLFLSFILSTCFVPELKTVVFTGSPSLESLTEVSARIEGTIISLEGKAEAHGHCWIEGIDGTPTLDNSLVNNREKNERGSFVSLLSGLSPGTEYSVRGYAVVRGKVFYGKIITFITLGTPKQDRIITTLITNITDKSALAGGRISKLGSDVISDYGHCWIAADVFNTRLPEITDSKTSLGQRTTIGEFSSKLENLGPNITYRVRAYAIINGSPIYGKPISFITGF